MSLSQWSTVAATNATAGTINFAEGQVPSSVNDSARQLMADVRSWYENAQWVDFGDAPTYISGTSFSVPGNLTARYPVGQRLKFTITAGTVYGVIATSAYTSLTTLTMTMDSTALDSGLNTGTVAPLIFTSLSNVPRTDLANTYTGNNIFSGIQSFNTRVNFAQSANIASASTTDLSTATGNAVTITGTTTITAFGTVTAGTVFYLIAGGSFSISNNVTSLIIPGGGSLNLKSGDSVVILSLGSGNWKVLGVTFSAVIPVSNQASNYIFAYKSFT